VLSFSQSLPAAPAFTVCFFGGGAGGGLVSVEKHLSI
jgi:hypothetical protein